MCHILKKYISARLEEHSKVLNLSTGSVRLIVRYSPITLLHLKFNEKILENAPRQKTLDNRFTSYVASFDITLQQNVSSPHNVRAVREHLNNLFTEWSGSSDTIQFSPMKLSIADFLTTK